MKFRVKLRDTNKLEEFVVDNDGNEIFISSGVNDKNGKQIFEGDYIVVENYGIRHDDCFANFRNIDSIFEVVFKDAAFWAMPLFNEDNKVLLGLLPLERVNVIGNVIDTPLTSERIQEI